MASSSNIKILTNEYHLLHVVDYPKATSEVIAQGDLLEENGSGAEVVDGAANNIFLGVALTGSEAADTRRVAIMIRGVIQIQLAAAQTATFGAAFGYSAGANGTAWTFTALTAEGIVWALEAISSAGSGKALVDVVALESGIFETVTT